MKPFKVSYTLVPVQCQSEWMIENLETTNSPHKVRWTLCAVTQHRDQKLLCKNTPKWIHYMIFQCLKTADMKNA